MQYKEDQFTCADGDQLFFRNWIPPEAPLAVLIIIHGLSDHSGRYQSIVVNLVPRRIAIYSFDQRSHGRSPGQHGHIDSFSMDAGIDNTGLSRDPDVVQTFLDDPLCHGKGTPRLATELSKAVADTNANAARFQPPLLITHGTGDHMTDPEASHSFYENAASTNKAYIAYEGGYHEGHNDIHRERVIIDIAQWLEEQIRVITRQPEKSE